MRGGEDVVPRRSPYAIEWNQKKTHLMSSQGIKHFLYAHKQPLKDPKKVFSLELSHIRHHPVICTCLERIENRVFSLQDL